METTRIQSGATERIRATALNSTNTPLLNLTDLLISIQRVSDGMWFDFADLTFKAAGWTTRRPAMTQVSATLAPGQYVYDFATATITNAAANDSYLVTVTQSPGTTVKNVPQVGEIKVGQYVDNIDAALSSIATSIAAILKIERNDWEIVAGQMIFYDDDGVSPLYTFALTDKDGDPCTFSAARALNDVFKRTRGG